MKVLLAFFFLLLFASSHSIDARKPKFKPSSRKTPSPTINKELKMNIDVFYSTAMTIEQSSAFKTAFDKLTKIITRDMAASTNVFAGQFYCGILFPETLVVDDILIVAGIKHIDGPGKILARAGPCGYVNGIPRLGIMTFDEADAQYLIKNGQFSDVILHETLHVLGIGTLWESMNLITPHSDPGPSYVGEHIYTGINGNEGNQIISGPPVTLIEGSGGVGTRRSHWKEAAYDSEIMTGYVEPKGTRMPLSALTVLALKDLGFSVDVSMADTYTIPARRLRTTSEETDPLKLDYGNDILEFPYQELEATVKPGREVEFEIQTITFRKKKKKHHTI